MEEVLEEGLRNQAKKNPIRVSESGFEKGQP